MGAALLSTLISILGKWLMDWLTEIFKKSQNQLKGAAQDDPDAILDKMILNARGYPMRRMLLKRAKRANIVKMARGEKMDPEDVKELKSMAGNVKAFE